MTCLLQVLMSLTVPGRGGARRCSDPDCLNGGCGGNRLELMDEPWEGTGPVPCSIFSSAERGSTCWNVLERMQVPANKLKAVIVHHKTEG